MLGEKTKIELETCAFELENGNDNELIERYHYHTKTHFTTHFISSSYDMIMHLFRYSFADMYYSCQLKGHKSKRQTIMSVLTYLLY